jgi:hypothetical protein
MTLFDKIRRLVTTLDRAASYLSHTMKCHICGYEMLPPGPHSLCESRDHIVPRSKGGKGKGAENIALAHRLCNSERGSDEITDKQLRYLKARIERAIRHGALKIFDGLDKETSCRSKTRYRTALIATRQAYALSENRGEDFEPYLCRYCGEYHVGHA